jgi:hypothetical protein
MRASIRLLADEKQGIIDKLDALDTIERGRLLNILFDEKHLLNDLRRAIAQQGAPK